jgi:tryptophan-rich sensory protein
MEYAAPSYGRCFASLALGLAPIFLILGIAAIFGANTVTANGHNVYGLTGLIVAMILNVVFAAIFAGLQKLGYLIIGLIGRVRRPEGV